MQPFHLLIFLLSSSINGNYLDKHNPKSSLIFTKAIQEFRQEIQIFKATTLSDIDEAFFKLYLTFNNEIHRYIPELVAISQVWDETCENFPTGTLNAPQQRRLSNICDDTAKFMRKLMKKPQSYLRKLHSSPFKASKPVEIFEIFFKNLDFEISNRSSQSISNCLPAVRYSILMNYEVLANETVNMLKELRTETNRFTRHFSKFVLNFIDDIEK